MQFTFEQIDQLKRQYTDKLVAVDTGRPELQRFSGITGTVKTVKMSGRALVEFDAYNNIGWYDIDLDFLRVIDQPLPKIEAKAEPAPAKKAAPAAKAAPAEKPAAAAKPAAAGKKSTADILAAARAGKAAAPGGQAAPAAKKPPAEKPAAAAGKMATADILAAARAKKQQAEEQPAPVSEGSVAEQEVEAASEPRAPAAPKAPKPQASSSLPTTTAEKIDWCRQADAK